MTQKFNKIIFLIVNIVVFTACVQKMHTEPMRVSLLIDETDSNIIIPSANSILSLFDFNQNACREMSLKVSYISEYSFTNESFILLNNCNEDEKSVNMFQDPYFREKQVGKFRKDITAILSVIKSKSDYSKPETQCVKKISQELTRLSKGDSAESYLFIASDLIENTDATFRGYSEKVYQGIINNEQTFIQKLAGILEEKGNFPSSLSNIKIIILYKPISKKNDVLFNAFMSAYKLIFEKRNASVYIKSSPEINKYSYE